MRGTGGAVIVRVVGGGGADVREAVGSGGIFIDADELPDGRSGGIFIDADELAPRGSGGIVEPRGGGAVMVRTCAAGAGGTFVCVPKAERSRGNG